MDLAEKPGEGDYEKRRDRNCGWDLTDERRINELIKMLKG